MATSRRSVPPGPPPGFRWASLALALLLVVVGAVPARARHIDYKSAEDKLKKSDFAAALDLLRKAIEDDPKPECQAGAGVQRYAYVPHFQLGRALLGLGRPCEALDAFAESRRRGVITNCRKAREEGRLLDGLEATARAGCPGGSPPPAATGACCFADGCREASEPDCRTRLGGTFLGVGRPCEDCPRPPSERGNCCDGADRIARNVTEEQCEQQALARWVGARSCDELGACCTPDGRCVPWVFPEECTELRGRHAGAGRPCAACAPEPEPRGTCCFGDRDPLQDVAQRECEARAGTWLQSGRCPERGNCCADGTPLGTLTRAACAAAGGTWEGSAPCPAPAQEEGACVFSEGGCRPDYTRDACLVHRGARFLGPGSTCPTAPEPRANCCFPDREPFLDMTRAQCERDGGRWQREPCPRIGNCCRGGELVGRLTREACSSEGGRWTGESACPAAEASGYCCDDDGRPLGRMTERECARARGRWNGEAPCVPAPPPPVAGNCCLDGRGRRMTEDECSSAGGTWRGDDPCPPAEERGACCLEDGRCVLATARECRAQGGAARPGETCGPDWSCARPEPEGACCVEARCTEETRADCRGTWLEGSSCAEADCEPAAGPGCCFGPGECEPLDERRCLAEGGYPVESCRSCRRPVPQRVGACCLPDGTCTDLSEMQCLRRDGRFQAGSWCSESPCP